MGELHPAAREAYDLPRQRIALLELDLDLLLANLDKPAYYRPISRFPLVAQDMALVMDEAVPAYKVEEIILKVGGESIAEVRLFDVYRGEPIPAGKKSLAYAISYQDLERTLTDKNVARVREKIRVQLERELNAVLRSE
jgi:phenylalanyl-tRNA synthetase beta chain